MKNIFISVIIFIAIAGNLLAVEDRVVAVVNDSVVTKSDLDSEVKLTLRQMGRESVSARQLQALVQKSLATLVDRELKREYAKANNIRVTNEDISIATHTILKNNNLTEAQYKKYIKGVERAALENVSDEIRWRKIIGQAVRSQVVVSNVEVDRLIAGMSKSKEVAEWELSQIFMAIGKGKPDSQILARIAEIAESIKNEEATFSQMARAFSEDAAAARGGYMGWFSKGEILPELIAVAEKLELGEVSEPIKTATGWHIIKLEQRKVSQPITVKPLQELELRILKINKTKDKKLDRSNYKKLKSIAGRKTNAEIINKFEQGFEKNSTFSSRDMGWVNLGQLTELQQKLVAKTRVGQVSRIMETEDDWQAIYVVSKRSRVSEKLIEYRERIKKHMVENRVELKARKFLRELREKSFIDVRI